MNKNQIPDQKENSMQSEKNSRGQNNEEQLRQNITKENDPQSVDHDKSGKVIPMHEEDTLGNP